MRSSVRAHPGTVLTHRMITHRMITHRMNGSPGGPVDLLQLNQQIVTCRKCARLVRHCGEVAEVKRRAWLDWDYWGRPVPSFGDPAARLLIVGLAPGAHGANRTGRMFTGDKSGDFLYRSLHRAGFASQPESRSREDGLVLRDAWITAAAHCAPPDNKPERGELLNCRPYLLRELKLLDLKVVVALGKIALDAYLDAIGERPSRFPFGHNVLHDGVQPALLCSYHPSQQNTSTGRLTQGMLDAVFARAAEIIGSRD
ncbi:MAG TPA: uracil-DNA glycosylase [Bryobacteraceae bacterium]|nr:uracil-DNA glycosylase [Bryobacteraceae bacterium]